MTQEEIDYIRNYYNLPEYVTDETIERDLDGSLGQLSYLMQEFKKELNRAMKKEYYKLSPFMNN